jgi:hypothetical protein
MQSISTIENIYPFEYITSEGAHTLCVGAGIRHASCLALASLSSSIQRPYSLLATAIQYEFIHPGRPRLVETYGKPDCYLSSLTLATYMQAS